MFSKLRQLNINIWDLNLVLTIVGFPVFTMLVTTSWSSIAFRGIAVLVALMSLVKTKIHFDIETLSKFFLFILLYESIQMWADFYLGEYANTPFEYSRMQAMLYNLGVVWLPTLAICSSIKYINWNAVLWMCFLFLGFSVIKGDLTSVGAELTADGRINMSDRISPISYGDYSAFMVLLSTSLLLKYKDSLSSIFNLKTIILIIGIFAGIYGVAKAGSRGPLVGMTFGFAFLFLAFPGKWKSTIILILLISILTGALSMNVIEEFAPALVSRFTLTFKEGDTGNRDILFNMAMQKWEGHHLFGTNCVYLEFKEFNSYHNVYLDAFVATGIIGGLIFSVSMMLLTAKSYFYKLKKTLTPPEFFFISLFLFHVGRGFSGIILVANVQIVAAFIIANMAIKNRLNCENY